MYDQVDQSILKMDSYMKDLPIKNGRIQGRVKVPTLKEILAKDPGDIPESDGNQMELDRLYEREIKSNKVNIV